MTEHFSFTNIAHGVLWHDSALMEQLGASIQQAFPRPLFSIPPNNTGTISSLMHIYFGCIMLLRNLLQDTVGDIRIRKLLETSQTLSGLGLSCDTIKRKHHRSHFTTLRPRRVQLSGTLDSISSDASFYQVLSTLRVLFSPNNTNNSLNNPA